AYNVKGREVKVTDKFDLKEAKTPNVVNFLSWGEIDASNPGVVKINADGHKATLTYDASRFDASVTDKELPDTRLSNVWGPKISKISLTDKNPSQKGTYTYTIKAEK
ncbi:MAG: heparinase, partial [Paramuribaculum sp.]|nr:heparinase [Paramuribaculum sp.]